MAKITNPTEAKALVGELSALGVRVRSTRGPMTDAKWLAAGNLLYDIFDQMLFLMRCAKEDPNTKIALQLAAKTARVSS